MSIIFPPEIINYSAESYYNRINTRSKIIYLSVICFIGLAIVLLPLIYIDITVQSRGVIRTPFENTLIQSAVYAEVTSFTLAENKQVKAGDTLLVLNTERLNEQVLLENRKLEKNKQFMDDLASILRESCVILTPKFKGEYRQYISKIKQQQTIIDHLKRESEVSKRLYDKEVVPEFEYLQQKNNLDKAESVLSSLKEECLSTWQAEHTRLELENQTLESNIKQLEKEKRQYIITAPTSGTLIQVAGFRPGNFIAPNQPLASISSADSLLAECYISPKDIGYLSNNQEVVFQMDAFNYREWGMVSGKVTEILNDVVSVQEQPMFRVRCKLNNPCLKLKNGYEGHLKKGMTMTGRFYLTRRSLWQLLFDKTDSWMNPKMMKM